MLASLLKIKSENKLKNERLSQKIWQMKSLNCTKTYVQGLKSCFLLVYILWGTRDICEKADGIGAAHALVSGNSCR